MKTPVFLTAVAIVVLSSALIPRVSAAQEAVMEQAPAAVMEQAPAAATEQAPAAATEQAPAAAETKAPAAALIRAPAAAAEQVPVGPAKAYYRWIDRDGHIQYTDFEPIGVPSELVPLTPEDAEDDAPMLSSAADDRRPDPFHDQDQQILPIEHIGPCADARRQLAVLHASLPVYQDAAGLYQNAWRGDTYRGQRQYLDAETRTEAIGNTRSAVLKHCSDPEAFAREADAFRNEVGTN